MEEPTDDQLLASAARFLIDGGEEEAASALLSCSIAVDYTLGTWGGFYTVYLTCPRVVYDILEKQSHPITKQIHRAIKAVFPTWIPVQDPDPLSNIEVSAEVIDIDPDWRTELLEIARGQNVHNQAPDAAPTQMKTWMNLRFRSVSEMRIAQALDRKGTLFFPNCRARLGLGTKRFNREPDFLVCYEGKWGILEVDGEPFHPPSRTVQDHERDRLFRTHGIRVVEHYDASECFENPDGVVQQFLDILKQA